MTPDYVPDEYVAEAILPGLGDLRGRWVLLLRADLARPALAQAVQAAGGYPRDCRLLHAAGPTRPGWPAGALSGVDIVTFTSSSTVRNFVALAQAAHLDPHHLPGSPLFVCIGPITASTAHELGLPVHIIASEYTTEGLIQAILDFDQ